MSDLVGNPEDRFSHNEAQFITKYHRTMTLDSPSNSLNIWFKAYTDAVEMIRYTLATKHVYLVDR